MQTDREQIDGCQAVGMRGKYNHKAVRGLFWHETQVVAVQACISVLHVTGSFTSMWLTLCYGNVTAT